MTRNSPLTFSDGLRTKLLVCFVYYGRNWFIAGICPSKLVAPKQPCTRCPIFQMCLLVSCNAVGRCQKWLCLIFLIRQMCSLPLPYIGATEIAGSPFAGGKPLQFRMWLRAWASGLPNRKPVGGSAEIGINSFQLINLREPHHQSQDKLWKKLCESDTGHLELHAL